MTDWRVREVIDRCYSLVDDDDDDADSAGISSGIIFSSNSSSILSLALTTYRNEKMWRGSREERGKWHHTVDTFD